MTCVTFSPSNPVTREKAVKAKESVECDLPGIEQESKQEFTQGLGPMPSKAFLKH